MFSALYPKRYRVCLQCETFEAQRPKKNQSRVLTPERYDEYPPVLLIQETPSFPLHSPNLLRTRELHQPLRFTLKIISADYLKSACQVSASSLRWKLLGTRLFKYLSDFLCQLNSLLTLGTWDRPVMTIPVFAPSMRCVFARLWLVDVNSSVHGQFDIVTTDETVKLRLPLVEFYSFKIRKCWCALALFLSIVKWRLLLRENYILISPLNGQNFYGKITENKTRVNESVKSFVRSISNH